MLLNIALDSQVAMCQQLLCAECRSDTFFQRRFQLVVLCLQLADQGAADEVLFRSLRDESGAVSGWEILCEIGSTQNAGAVRLTVM